MIKPVLTPLLTAFLCTTAVFAEEARPEIGLVLGGGGALGFAHVGVLKALEEHQIPIDYIGGTSMGSIVAGMYASGMSPEEIEQRFLDLNWWDVLKDRSPNQFLTYRRKFENKRYMGAEFGLQNWKPRFSPGMSYGQKLNNVLETFALNSAGITDFDQLNIPYRAVATDLRSGTSVTLKSGNLAKAMRASMAVPGAFTPVRMDDRVFVDGGIFNNIPVDVVKSMGADIIIAVDVGAASAEKSAQSEYLSLGEVVSRTYTIMQRPDQEKQLLHADIIIAPDLADSSSTHFHKAKDIIPTGYQAAARVHSQLSQLSADNETYAAFLEKQRKKYTDRINISTVDIGGKHSIPTGSILPHVKCKPGELNLQTVYEDLSRIHGLGHFQTVTYDLLPGEEGHELTYYATEKFWGPTYLHFGIKFEISSESTLLWSILLNYNQTQLNDFGGELWIDLEAGGHKRFIEAEWYQPLSEAGRFFVAPSVMLSSEDINFFIGDDDIADIDEELISGQFDFGISAYELGEFRIGLAGGHAFVNGQSGLVPLEKVSDSVVGASAEIRLDQLDDPIFPTTGFRFELDGFFTSQNIGSSRSFNRLNFKFYKPLTLGRHTVTPKLSVGSSFGSELPFYALFDAGAYGGFSGYAPYQLYGNYYGIGSIGYRYRLGQLPPTLGDGVFALARFDVGNAWFNQDDIGLDNLTYGGMIGLAADTKLGTCALTAGKAEELNNVRIYFMLGNKF